jgi:hypothetical protein
MGSERPVAARQRSRALSHANHVRVARARLKRRLASGHGSAAEIISAPPYNLVTMPVGQILLSQPGWGPVRSRRLLQSVSVPERKQVGTLTLRQQRALVACLEEGEGQGPAARST